MSVLNVVFYLYFYFLVFYTSLETSVLSKQLPNLNFLFKDSLICNAGMFQTSFQLLLHWSEIPRR